MKIKYSNNNNNIIIKTREKSVEYYFNYIHAKYYIKRLYKL